MEYSTSVKESSTKVTVAKTVNITPHPHLAHTKSTICTSKCYQYTSLWTPHPNLAHTKSTICTSKCYIIPKLHYTSPMTPPPPPQPHTYTHTKKKCWHCYIDEISHKLTLSGLLITCTTKMLFTVLPVITQLHTFNSFCTANGVSPFVHLYPQPTNGGSPSSLVLSFSGLLLTTVTSHYGNYQGKSLSLHWGTTCLLQKWKKCFFL